MRKLSYPIADFTYDVQRRVFAAEVSTLTAGGRRALMGPVFADAADPGFEMVGRTRCVTFVLQHEEIDAEGDLRWWEFQDADGDYRVLVFNT